MFFQTGIPTSSHLEHHRQHKGICGTYAGGWMAGWRNGWWDGAQGAATRGRTQGEFQALHSVPQDLWRVLLGVITLYCKVCFAEGKEKSCFIIDCPVLCPHFQMECTHASLGGHRPPSGGLDSAHNAT